MEWSNEVLINLALNVVGYIAAGGLMLVLRSLVRRRRTEPSGTSLPGCGAGRDIEDRPRPKGARQSIEFVRLGETVQRGEPQTAETVRLRGICLPTTAARRDRVETIALARRLIKAGATAERIRSVLPISEGELALLMSARTSE